MQNDEKFEKLNMEMFQKLMNESPHYATFYGLHEPYDWQLPGGSSKNVLKTLEIARKWVEVMKKTVNYEKLSADHKIDWKVIEQSYEKIKFQVNERRDWETNPDAFNDIGDVFFIMLTRDYAPMGKRVDAIVARMEKLPKYLDEFRTRFDKSRPVKLWTEVAIESCQQLPGLFQFLVASTKGMVSEELHNRLLNAAVNLQQPIKQHLAWLQSLLPKADASWALGKAKFDKWLKLRGFDMTADEILKLGVKYLAELEQQREELAEKIAPGKSVKEVMQMIGAKAPKTFEEALKATKDAMEQSRSFIIKNDLATIYPSDRLHVKETPAFMAPLLPFAALISPAKFDKQQEGIYVVTRPRDIKNLGKHLNHAGIPGTAVHEGFPGHFLQGPCLTVARLSDCLQAE